MNAALASLTESAWIARQAIAISKREKANDTTKRPRDRLSQPGFNRNALVSYQTLWSLAMMWTRVTVDNIDE